ncbi:hypothetical protein [Flocculibacter collagenilyticus]|uniref:hypothetical protein n=1 Tax=Flocculibacter collagenilyticus TaxID=2744479 RepID=UPI0018F3A8F5|nr:hypothetical protein [Flocculibacter collagenilyticus]
MKQMALYALLFCLFWACIWIGWSDYEFIKPAISQEEIRESIRFYIKRVFQVSVQFIVPIAILVYFAKRFLHRNAS